MMQVMVFYGDLVAILPWERYAYLRIRPNKQIIVKIPAAIKNGNGNVPKSLNYQGLQAVP